MRRRAPQLQYQNEAELCAAFSKWALAQGWTSYAETAGFDVLLVHGDGTQIGVQAKMRFNIAVLEQITEDGFWPDKAGPDYRGVLVPHGASRTICGALGIIPFECGYQDFQPQIETRSYQDWHYQNPAKRCPLPKYVPDVAAGSPAPTQLTEWKIAALSIVAILELRGYVTRKDFGLHRIDSRRWTRDWLIPGAEAGQFIAGPEMPQFIVQHPVVYPQVKADVAKLMEALR